MARSVSEIQKRVDRMRRAHYERDARMRDVADVRSGNLDRIMPQAMPDIWPKPIVANLIDTSARDQAEAMASMPSINCTSGVLTSNASKKFTAKRTKIAYWYVDNSDLKVSQIDFCDHYNTFGIGIYVIEPDFDKKTPRIRVENPMSTYPEIDIHGKIHSFTKVWNEPATTLAEKFPEYARVILGDERKNSGTLNNPSVGDSYLEVVKYCDADQYLIYLPARSNQVIAHEDNPFKEVPVAVAIRPGFDDEIRGAFDGAIWVQLAKARMALLGLEATEKSVRAPLAVPRDLQKMTFGDDAILRTERPRDIVRVGIDFPQGAAQEAAILERELMQGTRTPEARSGNIDASVITGKGINALMGGFNQVVATAQVVISSALERAIQLCFQMDEKFWGSEKKEIRGVSQGSAFEETYVPRKDIKGNHTVDVTYGFASGLDPSRALVFLLQLRGDNLVPRDFVQRQLPMDLDVVQLQTQIDNEQVTDALKQGVFAYVQSVGLLAQQGQDPMEVLTRVAKIISFREKGKPMHEAILEAFEPPEPTPEQLAAQQQGIGGPTGGGVPGVEASGLPQGVAEGQAGMAPGGRPDIMSLLAGLTQGGQPTLGASVRRQVATG